MSPSYKIAIIGAGPGGCTLAHLLRRAKIEVVLFEGEASADARQQGGSLDLNEKGGLGALKQCGLYSEFEKHARYDGEAVAIADKRNARYLATNGASSSKDSGGRPEIDRARLRELLCQPLSQDGTLRWGHRIQSIDANGTLNFTSGTTATGFDLIVGADGAWSKVRPLLTDEIPTFSGVAGLEASIPHAAEQSPDIYKLTNKGLWLSFGNGRSIGCQQHGDGTIRVAFWHACAEDWVNDYNLNDPQAIKEVLHQEHHDWAPELHQIIDAVDPSSFMARTLYQLPIGMTWESRAGLTLIGDAAHLMSPFAGEGVNCAMADACELSAAIAEAAAKGAIGRDGLAPYAAKFEMKMRTRVTPIQQLTWLNICDWYLTPGSPHSVVERFAVRNIVHDLGWYLRIPVAIVVYTYFFFVKWRMGAAPSRIADVQKHSGENR